MTGKFQVNIEDNAFYQMIRSFINLGVIPQIEQNILDLTFIDYASRAVRLLYDRKELKNEIYHIINPNSVSLTTVAKLLNQIGVTLNTLPILEFLDYLCDKDDGNKFREFSEKILLHYNLMENLNSTKLVVHSKKTDLLLNRLGFHWPVIKENHVEKMIVHCKEVNFL
ncbi:hypothetical protein L1765_09980 [Microaerobacter geothermalis]|uniref:hypothetical protein n=1 Tax=Microaerobacter geothermalis TaxID=674972 RepID=UPI001F35C1C0|nr:hypothetical protein [Microaerobacter geothermalis]MCF6094292.1 hypothetical protein [Microaerobacter geothermalis]